MFAITINFYIFLVVAMFNKHAVTVIFNHFNEALIEYVIYFAILPIIIYSVYYEIRETRMKRKETKYKTKKKENKNARKRSITNK